VEGEHEQKSMKGRKNKKQEVRRELRE